MKRTRRWREANNYDPYKRMAAAVIHKACQDYWMLCRKLESKELKSDLIDQYETECKKIEEFLLNPRNIYTEYLGLDNDMIHDYIMLKGKQAEDWPVKLLAKELNNPA